MAERQRRNAADLVAVVDAAIIFAPRGFLRIAEQVRACQMMVMANLAATQPAEIALRPIRAGAIPAVGFLVVDALHFVTAVQAVP